ncbi:hypothetical protein PG994_007329 [Apiospora phragmitis]|uniref:Acyl-coenzyme A diphosphatase SCS3 n=1 Tax=Apiospora phragmitis TaxID=2905665 RepID=A0ABR1V0K0_9PEZI
MADTNTSSLRSRSDNKMAATSTNVPESSSSASSTQSTAANKRRNPPHFPTALETLALVIYPTVLAFGTLFSALSPQTRASPYDSTGQSHVQALAPSYFARKDNLFNVLFVKRGWAWITAAFVAFAVTHPAVTSTPSRAARAGLRWAAVTGWWFLVTQWCFGPALIDRGFRLTGGQCAVAESNVVQGDKHAGARDFATAVACKAAGGRWSGGHDISGHVFLLVLGSWFLLQEVGWVAVRVGALTGRRDERTVVMGDGAVKGAGVVAEKSEGQEDTTDAHRTLGLGGRFALVVVGLCLWMLLMTAIYFHTWFEKFTGLMTAFVGIYPVYILPRWIPALRDIVGLPGI